jgi:hypothetical protein
VTVVSEVLLLTRPSCSLCEHARAVLARLAAEFPLAVSSIELDSPEGQALALRGGILFPPGVFLDGVPFAYGRLSERKLRRELQRRSATAGQP